MRTGMQALRRQLAAELRDTTGSDRFGFVASHRGMFSLIGVTGAQADRLREAHGVYIVADGRINVAGLNAATVPVLARALRDVGA
jgi:aromatic-amino-acid transaminase